MLHFPCPVHGQAALGLSGWQNPFLISSPTPKFRPGPIIAQKSRSHHHPRRSKFIDWPMTIQTLSLEIEQRWETLGEGSA